MGKTNSDPRAIPWWTDLVPSPGLQRAFPGCRRSLDRCRMGLRQLPAFHSRGRSFRSQVLHLSGPGGRRHVHPRRERAPVLLKAVSRTASPAGAIRGFGEPRSASVARPVSAVRRGAALTQADLRCRRESVHREPTRLRVAGSRRVAAVRGRRQRRGPRPSDDVAPSLRPLVRRSMTSSDANETASRPPRGETRRDIA
jgi:hypothetical protein